MKYPERGLVKHGVVSSLFSQLYFVVTGCFTIFGLGIIISSNNYKTNTFSFSICLGSDLNLVNKTHQNFLFPIFISIWPAIVINILYLSIRYYVNVRKIGKHPPILYGIYQRNLITFKETVIYITIKIFVGKALMLLYVLTESDKHTMKMLARTILLIYIFRDFLLVLYMHFNLNKVDIDKPLKPVGVFYIHDPVIVPRRYFERGDFTYSKAKSFNLNLNHSSKCKTVTSFKRAKIILVKPKKRIIDPSLQ